LVGYRRAGPAWTHDESAQCPEDHKQVVRLLEAEKQIYLWTNMSFNGANDLDFPSGFPGL
jgi:hypothetical protein